MSFEKLYSDQFPSTYLRDFIENRPNLSSFYPNDENCRNLYISIAFHFSDFSRAWHANRESINKYGVKCCLVSIRPCVFSIERYYRFYELEDIYDFPHMEFIQSIFKKKWNNKKKRRLSYHLQLQFFSIFGLLSVLSLHSIYCIRYIWFIGLAQLWRRVEEIGEKGQRKILSSAVPTRSPYCSALVCPDRSNIRNCINVGNLFISTIGSTIYLFLFFFVVLPHFPLQGRYCDSSCEVTQRFLGALEIYNISISFSGRTVTWKLLKRLDLYFMWNY